MLGPLSQSAAQTGVVGSRSSANFVSLCLIILRATSLSCVSLTVPRTWLARLVVGGGGEKKNEAVGVFEKWEERMS